MDSTLWLSAVTAIVWALLYHRLSLTVSTAVIASSLAAGPVFAAPGTAAVVLAWLVFLAVAVPLNIPALRRTWISARVLRVFRKVMPAMSRTEREALEAGSVWWEAELFSGRPNWRRLLALPAPRLSAEEQAFLDGPVETLCRMLDDWHITAERQDLPPAAWDYIKKNGFFAMIIPKRYGGLEFSALGHSSVVMKIATRSISAAVTVMVPNSLGPAELLLHYGTEQQKDYYLPRLARGEEVPCFALTGPEAGSDAGAMPDRGVVCRGRFRGAEIIGIRLNWDKRYITLGPVATVLGLAFKLYDPEHLLGENESLGITLALIPTDTPGITIGTRHAPLDMAFQNGPNSGRDVFIPLDWIIGGAARAGQGWRMLMESLAAGRSISLPALSTGAAKLASRATGGYARIRRQFKQPIGYFEGVEEALARIAGNTYLMEAARSLTTVAVDQGEKPGVVSAIVKYQLTERMRRVINDAVDIQGGAAICLGPRNLLGRIYQAVPISITVEGANILTRTLIVFGQGAVRCHPFVLREMTAVNGADPARATLEFDRALFGHIGFTLSNAARALFLGLSGARLVFVPEGAPLHYYYRQLTRMSAAFALCADAAMLTLGGALKRREKLSGRFADILSHLYLASAVLKHFADQGRPAEDLPLLRWSCVQSLFIIQERLGAILDNFPNRFAAWCLRRLVFPLGRRYKAPSDKLGHEVAAIVLASSPARDRLTAGIYAGGEAIARLDAALAEAVGVEAVEKRLRAAVRTGDLDDADEETLLAQGVARGVVDEDEATRYRSAGAARREVIKVDDFAPRNRGTG